MRYVDVLQALLAVFRGRANDPRQRESGLDRCEVSVDYRSDQAKCRFNIKMIARHGKKPVSARLAQSSHAEA